MISARVYSMQQAHACTAVVHSETDMHIVEVCLVVKYKLYCITVYECAFEESSHHLHEYRW